MQKSEKRGVDVTLSSWEAAVKRIWAAMLRHDSPDRRLEGFLAVWAVRCASHVDSARNRRARALPLRFGWVARYAVKSVGIVMLALALRSVSVSESR